MFYIGIYYMPMLEKMSRPGRWSQALSSFARSLEALSMGSSQPAPGAAAAGPGHLEQRGRCLWGKGPMAGGA